MQMGNQDVQSRARSFAGTAAEGFRDAATYLRLLPEDAWDDPTGCAEWTMRTLAGHIVGEAVWFPHLVRTVTEGAQPLPDDTWGKLSTLPGNEMADRTAEGADNLERAVNSASVEHLQQPVDLGFAKLPLWQAMYVCMIEGTVHNWDAKAAREENATIPTPWAQLLASQGSQLAEMVAHRDALAEAEGTFLLRVGDGVGPVTIDVKGGQISVRPGETDSPDAMLHFTAEQYVRFIVGRLPLREAIANGDVQIGGDEGKAEGLSRVFKGIAN